MFCPNCGNPVAEQDVVCLSCGAKPPVARIKIFNTNFMLYWVCWAVAGLSLPSMLIILTQYGRDAALAFPLLMTFLISYFGGGILMCMLHYRLWKLLPKGIAQTTPGKAVGFLFIPFFNFYWISVSYLGLSKGMNEMLRQRGIQYHVNQSLSITFGILLVIPASTWEQVPILAVLHVLAQCIAGFFFYKSAKNGAVALLQHENVETQEL